MAGFQKKEGGNTQELFQAFTKVPQSSPGSQREGTTELQGKGGGKEKPLIWAIDAISLPQGGYMQRLICKYNGSRKWKKSTPNSNIFFPYGEREVNF